MPILILNVTTGVTFKYKYHKLASLTSQSREYSWFLLQISEYSSIFPISISSQNTLFTNDSRKCNQYEMSFVPALSTSHPGRPHPCVLSSSQPWSPHSGDVPQIWYQVLVVTIDIDGHTLCDKYSSSSLQQNTSSHPINYNQFVSASVKAGAKEWVFDRYYRGVYYINQFDRQLNVLVQFYTLQAHLRREWSLNSRMSGRVQHFLGEFASMLYWTMLAACTVGPGTVVTCSR